MFFFQVECNPILVNLPRIEPGEVALEDLGVFALERDHSFYCFAEVAIESAFEVR